MLAITDTLQIPEAALEERFVRASGPGGQNVNKVSTAVELRLDLGRAALPDAVRSRLAALAGHRLTADGVLVVDAREHRTQKQNRDAARARLVALLVQAARTPRKRKPTRPTAAARTRRLEGKSHRSDAKRRRAAPRGDE